MPKPKHAAIPDSITPLVIGGGGREHALTWRLKQSKSVKTIYATHAHGDAANPGIQSLAQAPDFAFNIKEVYRLKQFIEQNGINLVVVGPEGPLASGIADQLAELEQQGCYVFGPTRSAAQLESDKAWAKQLMRAAAVPTAEARVFPEPPGALDYIESREDLPVIKASGLAGGKGVILPKTIEEAREAVMAIMDEKRFGDAGDTVLVEERLVGPEVSVFALIDGNTVVVLDACQDHKRLNEGDLGPNTGGMGAYCPPPEGVFDGDDLNTVVRDVLVPTIDGLKREGLTYRGVLYAGLMMTPAGPKVLEYNVRFGDPECQCLLRRVTGDFGKLLYATASGNLDQVDFGFDEKAKVCVVLASEGYPEKPLTGVEITGIEDAEAMDGVVVFHAGTERKDGKILTAGGRVLNVVASGATVAEARDRANAACEAIHFPGKQYRTDIAWQALEARVED